MPNSDPLPQADPTDIAEQSTVDDDDATDSYEPDEPFAEIPLETDPADYSEQRKVVDLSDDGYSQAE